VRIGTRGSALALAQTQTVADALGGAELVAITTSGDRQRDAGDKARWVKELDDALLRGDVDLAVHSAKDVPAELHPGVALVAAPPRADPRDALCGAPSLAALPDGARVGTSSVRRAAQLRALRADLDVAELRGNVDTRLRRLAEGDYAAIVLALAGLQRLGRADSADGTLDEFVPAAGQGVLLITARAGDGGAAAAARPLNDDDTLTCLLAERALVLALQADCATPVGANAVLSGDGELTLRCFVGREDGGAWLRDELRGPASAPEQLGGEAAQRLLAAGAAEVLGR
jgi:hydroxymethylbilane synthase